MNCLGARPHPANCPNLLLNGRPDPLLSLTSLIHPLQHAPRLQAIDVMRDNAYALTVSLRVARRGHRVWRHAQRW